MLHFAFDPEDNCLYVANSDQIDYDGDSFGDACDGNDDGDGIADIDGLCPATEIGAVVDDFECTALLGKGGMGEVMDVIPEKPSLNTKDKA